MMNANREQTTAPFLARSINAATRRDRSVASARDAMIARTDTLCWTRRRAVVFNHHNVLRDSNQHPEADATV